MPDPRKKLYSALSSKYDLGSYEEFNSKMNNPESRKKLFTIASQNFDLGSYNEFENKVKKKEVSQPISQETVSVSNTKTTTTPTLSVTEETQAPVDSDVSDGKPKYRLVGEKQKPITKEQEKIISDKMYSNTKPTVQKGKTAVERVYAMPKTGSAPLPIQNIDARPFLQREESKPLNQRIDSLEKDIFYSKQGSLDQANKVFELNQLKKQKEEKNNNLYNSFLQANKNTDLDLEESNKEVEDKFNQVGFVNNAKALLKNTWNTIVDVTGQGLSFGTEEQAPDMFRFDTDERKKYVDQANKEFYSALDYYKKLKKSDPSVKIPEYDLNSINARAKEIAVEESLASKKQQRINSFMEDVEDKGLKEVLLDYNDKKYDTITEEDKKLLNITTANKLAYEKSTGNLLNLVSQLKQYNEKGINPPQDFINLLKSESDLNNSLQKSYLKSQDEYTKKEKELGTLDENYDILKRDYGFWKNAYATTAIVGGESIRGLLGAANYLGQLPTAGVITANGTASRDNPIRDLSKRIGENVEEIRGSVESPIEAEDISSASDFGRWMTNSVIIPTTSFMTKVAMGTPGITTLVAESVGNTHEGMLDQMDSGNANYSQAQLIGVPAAKGAVDASLFIFNASLLKNTQRAIRSATAGEKDLIAKSVLNHITEKQLHGAAVMNGITIAKNAVDKFSGVDPNKNLLEGTGEATAVSIATVGMIDTAPKIAIGINSNFSLDGQALKISDNINKLQLALDKTPVTDENRKIIVDQIDLAKKNLKTVLTKQVRNISSLSDSQYKEVVKLNITKSNILENAKKIQLDSSLDSNIKSQIFEGLKQELNEVEQRRREIIENGPKIELEKLDPKTAEKLRSKAKSELESEAKNSQSIIPEYEIDRRAMVIHNEKTYKANDVIVGEAKPTEKIDEARKTNLTSDERFSLQQVNKFENAKVGDEFSFEEYKDGEFKSYKTKVKEIVDGKIIFENGKTQDDISSYRNKTAEDTWFAENKPEVGIEEPMQEIVLDLDAAEKRIAEEKAKPEGPPPMPEGFDVFAENKPTEVVESKTERTVEDIESDREKDLKKYDERDDKSLEQITPNNPNHEMLQVGQKWDMGYNARVQTFFDERTTDGEGVQVVTKVIEAGEYDSNGKLKKAPVVEVTVFDSKEQANKYIEDRYNTIKEKADKKEAQNKVNAKYDEELKSLENTKSTKVVAEAKPTEVTKPDTKGISKETSSNIANLTEDGKGNYVFYHISPETLKTIDPKMYGTNVGNVTSAPEKAAISRAGGVSMYYTAEAGTESMVKGNMHMVKVPESEVYDFNSDPLKLVEEAKKRFKEQHPDLPFTANDQFAQITKLANENGYKMVVGEWQGKTRAQTTEPMTPIDVKEMKGDVVVKPFKEQYESNVDKGYKSIIPESKEAKLKSVYDEINTEKSRANEYDELYRLAGQDNSKTPQENITKLIKEDKTLSKEVKDKYAEAIAYEPEQRRTVSIVGETVKVDNAPKGHHLNVGLLEGRTNKKMSAEDVLSKLPKDVKVISSTEIKGTEPSISTEISRPLTSSEMNKFLADTKQQAIAQLSDKNGILYDAKRGTSEGWGEFNPELFVTQDGKNLTEVKVTEVKPIIKSKLDAFKAKYIEKQVYDRTKLDTQVENAKNSLSKILPDIKFVIHENTESFVNETGKNAKGYYDPATKTIHINALEANARTVAHEVFHSVLLDKVKTDVNARDLTKRMINSISKTLEGNPELKKTLDDFVKNYDENIRSEEKMAELFGHLADGYEGFDAPTKSIVKRAMDRLAKMFGLKQFTEGEVVDMLKTLSGKVAAGEVVIPKDIKAISEGASSYISEPSNIERFQKTNEQKVVVGDHKLSFVKKSDLIDIDSLMKDISEKKQKVWFWVADQLGRGNYFDSKIDGEHYLDAGPSFALDPVNRSKNVIWASGKNQKEINNLIGKSDYIFIISGSPEKSKLFNKSIIDVVAKRAGDFDSFKKDVLESSKIKSINDILSSVKSWDELRDSPKRKEFLLAIQDQKDKNTPLKKTLENYNAIVDLNELRDGFYADNNFGLNDIMLVLKPTEFGGKSEHSTYENNILGEVVGVPDIKVNAFDIMPSDIKNKYKEDLGRSQQQQAVAPYGIGVKQIERFQESESYSDMKDIVKDMIDDGMSISEIKKSIGSELGADQVSLAERAHNELTAKPKTTSIKNEVVSAEREARGLTPVEKRDTYSTKVNYDETKSKVDSGEISPRDLATAIVENPGKVAITSEVSDALAYDRMRLSNEYEKVVKAIVEDPTSIENIIARNRLEKQIEYNDRASKYSGTISSHALLARKNIIKQDYSLDRLVMRYKAETGGKISESMRAKFDVLSTKLQEANAKLEQYESKIADRQVATEFEKIKRNADKEVRSNKRAATKEILKAEREDLYAKLKEIQREQMSRLSSNPLPVEMVPVISKLAKNLVMDGIVTLDGVVDEIHSNIKDTFEDVTKRDIRDALSGYGKFKLPTKDDVTAQLREIKSQAKLVSALEDAEAGKMPLKTGFSRSKASETVTELRKKVQEVIKKNGITSENLPEEKVWKSSEEKALKALKTRLKNREKELQGMLDSGNFEKTPRTITALDAEANKLKADVERIKNKVDIEIKKERLKNRTKVEKAVDFITTWRRNLLLTGVKVIGKLTAAAGQRTLISPIEEIAGTVLSKLPILSKVAEKAPREGNINVKAEVKAISQWWKKATYKDMREIIKSGKGELDLLHGKKTDLPPSIFDFFGQMHQALKQPAKRNEYFRSFEKRLANAEKNGVDISDPIVQATIGTQAYLDANRAIFMQENKITTAYKSAINTLERAGDSGKVVAGMLKIILPIVKVPTNFANEITSYSVGGIKALLALRNGIKDLTPDQADYIMRNIKKQSLGAAFIALGYFNAATIGGFYQRGDKRDEKDVKAGGLRVLGVDMPKWMTHTPLLEMLQIGATLKRVQDDYERKDKEGTAASVLAVTKGVVEEVPFARSPEEALKALSSPDNFNRYFRDLGESMINPQLTKEMGLQILPEIERKKAGQMSEEDFEKLKTTNPEAYKKIKAIREKASN